jgi:hypothetical protein
MKNVQIIQFYNYYYVQHLNATEFICGITLSPSLENVPFNILYCLFYCILTFTINLFLWFPFQSQQLRDISSTRFTRKNSWFKVAFSWSIVSNDKIRNFLQIMYSKISEIKYDPCINGGKISCKLIGQRRTVPEFRMGWYIIENNFIIWHPVVCSGLSSLDTMNNCRTVVLNGKQVLLIQFYNYYYVQHLNATEFICGITLSPSLENVLMPQMSRHNV